MNPGKLDRRLTIQTRTLTQDGAGGRVETWADGFDVWAELVSHQNSESILADADRAADDRQFRIRYRRGLASGTHRVFYQLKFYDITGITEDGRNQMLLLNCRAVQALTNV
jgi:SPP1 family predicted phage head-tail adaptor